MRKTILIIFLSFFSIVNSQNKLHKSAIENCGKMVKAWNNKEADKFVEYLTQNQYVNKERFIKDWKKAMMSKDFRVMSDLKLLRFSEYQNTQQTYFKLKSGGEEWGLLGISRNNGKTWNFSQFIGSFNYPQLKELFIPELDPIFTVFDKNYKTRTNFEKGKYIKNFEFEKLTGESNEISNYKGKIVVLNFWNTSCRPCIAEMPNLNKLVSKMKNKNVIFIAPASQNKNIKLMNKFLKKHQFNYEVVFYDYKNVGITILPTHIIIDKDSKVIAKLIGGQSQNIEKIENLLKSL